MQHSTKMNAAQQKECSTYSDDEYDDSQDDRCDHVMQSHVPVFEVLFTSQQTSKVGLAEIMQATKMNEILKADELISFSQ